jgi:hypothetical protein
MRLVQARVIDILINDSIEKRLQVVVDDNGTQHEIGVPLPDGWDAWTRTEKVQWVRDWITDHAQTHTYVTGTDVIFPDVDVKEQALSEFENLPGFATWTAQEASDWIESNVVDLDTAKTALSRTARALVYLRDIVIQRI